MRQPGKVSSSFTLAPTIEHPEAPAVQLLSGGSVHPSCVARLRPCTSSSTASGGAASRRQSSGQQEQEARLRPRRRRRQRRQRSARQALGRVRQHRPVFAAALPCVPCGSHAPAVALPLDLVPSCLASPLPDSPLPADTGTGTGSGTRTGSPRQQADSRNDRGRSKLEREQG